MNLTITKFFKSNKSKKLTLIKQIQKFLQERKLARNAIYNSASFLLISVVNFLTLPFFVSKLGVEQYGIYILVTGLFGYYGIFDLGLGQGLIKFVSERRAVEKNKEVIDGITSAFWIQVFIGIIVSSLLLIFSQAIVVFLNVGTQYLNITSQIIKIASIGFLFSMISSIFSSVLMGLQLYVITSKVDAINNVTLNILTLIILYLSNTYGLVELLILNVVSSAIIMIIYAMIIKRKIQNFRIKFYLDIHLLKIFFKFSIHIFLSKISSVFANYVVKFAISFYAGPKAVTYFTVPSKIIGAIGGVLSSASNTLMPYISDLKAEYNEDKIVNTLINVSFIFSAFGIPIFLFASIYSFPILDLWMGAEFANNSWLVLSIISISSVIGSFSTIPNQVVLGTGNSKLIGYFSVLTVISYSIFLPLLSKYFLLIGASFGLLVTSLLVITTVISKTTNYLKISTKLYIKEVFLVHLFPVILFILFGFFIIRILIISNLFKFILGGVFTGFYYLYLFIQYKNKLVKIT